MALLDGGGGPGPIAPPAAQTPDALLAKLRPAPRKVLFGPFETAGTTAYWRRRRAEEQARRATQRKMAEMDRADRAASSPSVASLNERLGAIQRQRRTHERRTAAAQPGPQPKVEFTSQPSNPFIDTFPDGQSRAAARGLVNRLPPHVRAVVTMALDPRDTVPLTSLDAELRQAVAGARAGSVEDLARMTADPKLLGRLTEAGKAMIGGREDAEEVRRMLARERPAFAPAAPDEMLRREQVIRETASRRGNFFKAAPPDGEFVDVFKPKGAKQPLTPVAELEQIDIPTYMRSPHGRAATEKKYSSFVDRLREEWFPTHPEYTFEVSQDGDGFDAFDEGHNYLRTFPLPSRLVETVHGQETAEKFAVRGFGALPKDSPLQRPGWGEMTLRVLGDTAELLDAPRQQVKKHVIEPALPEFEVPLSEVLPYAIPQVALADLAVVGLRRATGLEIPTVGGLISSQVIERVAPFTKDVNITDEVVAELTSIVLDPLNLLPGIGFGDQLVRVGARIGVRIAGREGILAGLRGLGPKALAKLGRDPEFLRLGERGIALLKAESGHLAAGGRAGQLEARIRVLQDIADGAPTTDEALAPVRRAMDDLVRPMEGAGEHQALVDARKIFPVTSGIEHGSSFVAPNGDVVKVGGETAMHAKVADLFGTEFKTAGAETRLPDGAVLGGVSPADSDRAVTAFQDRTGSIRVTKAMLPNGETSLAVELRGAQTAEQQAALVKTAVDNPQSNMFVDLFAKDAPATRPFDSFTLRAGERPEALRQFLSGLDRNMPVEWVAETALPDFTQYTRVVRDLLQAAEEPVEIGPGMPFKEAMKLGDRAPAAFVSEFERITGSKSIPASEAAVNALSTGEPLNGVFVRVEADIPGVAEAAGVGGQFYTTNADFAANHFLLDEAGKLRKGARLKRYNLSLRNPLVVDLKDEAVDVLYDRAIAQGIPEGELSEIEALSGKMWDSKDEVLADKFILSQLKAGGYDGAVIKEAILGGPPEVINVGGVVTEAGFKSTNEFPAVRAQVEAYMGRTGKTAADLLAEARAARGVPADLLAPVESTAGRVELTASEFEQKLLDDSRGLADKYPDLGQRLNKVLEDYPTAELQATDGGFLLNDGRYIQTPEHAVDAAHMVSLATGEDATQMGFAPLDRMMKETGAIRVVTSERLGEFNAEALTVPTRDQAKALLKSFDDFGARFPDVEGNISVAGVIESSNPVASLSFSKGETGKFRLFLNGLDRNPPRLDFAAPTVKASRARAMLEEAKRMLGEETGGGRAAPLQADDVVKIREGQFAGERGVVRDVTKGGRTLDIELESGRMVTRPSAQVDRVSWFAYPEQEVQTATSARLSQIQKLKEAMPGAKPARLKALNSKLEALQEQERLVKMYDEAMLPGGALSERAAQLDELSGLKERLARVKHETGRVPIRNRIVALEEAIGAKEAAAAPVKEAADVVEQVKQAYLASQSDVLDNLARREAELKIQLTPDRLGLLDSGELGSIEAQLREVGDEYARLRAETDLAAEHLATAARQIIEEGAITPKTLTIQDYERFAFSHTSPAGKAVQWLSKFPLVGAIVREPTRLIDNSVVLADDFVGHKFVAYGRLQDALDASTETAARALYARRLPFSISKKTGLEEVTGRPLPDVVKDWDQVKHMFGAEQDEFVQLLNQTRVEALRDYRVLHPEANLPEAWDEATHVFRTAVSKDGIDLRKVSQFAARSKPGSLRRMSYEYTADGMERGVKYGQDIVAEYVTGIHSLRQHAAYKSFLNSIKYEKGVPLKLFVAQEHRLTAALAAREYAWAKVARTYAHQSVLGRPAKPILRASKLFEVEPPEDVVRLVDRIAELNRAAKSPARTAELRDIRAEVDAVAGRNSARLKAAKTGYKIARETVNTSVQAEGARFGPEYAGMAVEVRPAPFGSFPELGGRLYLKDDIDSLLKLAGDSSNPFVALAKKTRTLTGVIKTGQTSLDPGFWFIQGLGAMGLDAANLARGRPTAIWGKSMYRSIVGLVNTRGAAEYWAKEASLHADDWAEFTQHARILTNHTAHSDEVVGELVSGGFIDKIERHIPVLSTVHPFSRAGNAFSNFMDAASWETWKALRPLAKAQNEVEELGAFVRNISGRSSTRALGISLGQEQVERAMLYASAYTRASTAILAKAAFDPLSFGGRQALKSLAGLGMAMTFLLGAGSVGSQLATNGGDFSKLDWNQLRGDITSAWDVTSSKFMTIRVGDAHYGFGGAMRSTVNAMAKMVALGFNDPKNLSPINLSATGPRDFINFDNPMLRFIRGKASPVVSTAWDVLSGRDFLGYQLTSWKDYLKVPEQMLPFAVQDIIDSRAAGFGNRAAIGAASWFGLRTFPISASQAYKEAAERELNDSWENLQGTALLKEAEKDKEGFPELHAAKQAMDGEQRRRGNEWQKADDLLAENKKETEAKLTPLAAQINWGAPGGGKLFADQYKYYGTQASNDWDLALKALGIDLSQVTPDQYPNKDKMLQVKLTALDPMDFKTPDGLDIDWDKFRAAQDALKSQMSPQNQRAVEERRFDVGDPQLEASLRLRQTAVDGLETYYNSPKYNGLNKDEEKRVDDLTKLVDSVRGQIEAAGQKVSRGEILQFMLETGYGDKKIVSTAFVLSKDAIAPMVRSTAKRDFLFDHPDTVVFYPNTFFDLGEEDRLLWQERFGMRTASEAAGAQGY